MSATSLGIAMKRAGFDKNEATFKVAITRYLNNGGTVKRGIALLREAEELPDVGLHRNAEKASPGTPVRQPNGDDEAVPVLSRGHSSNAKSSPDQRDGKGRSRAATGHSLSAQPACEPGKADIKALAAARFTAAKAIFAVNGIDIRSFTLGACRSESHRKGKEHYVLSVISGMTKHLPDTMHVRDVLSDDELKAIVRQAEAFANAA